MTLGTPVWQVVAANGSVLQLSDASPAGEERRLWQAMRQAGSSFAIATRISVRVIDDLSPSSPTEYAVPVTAPVTCL